MRPDRLPNEGLSDWRKRIERSAFPIQPPGPSRPTGCLKVIVIFVAVAVVLIAAGVCTSFALNHR